MIIVKVRVCKTVVFFHNVLSSQDCKFLFLKNVLQEYLLFFLIMCGPLSSQDCKILFRKRFLQDTFLFLLSYIVLSSQYGTIMFLKSIFSVSSFFIICVVQTRLQDFFRKGYLSSLLVYCHSHYGTILFLKSILQDFFSFFFLILYVVQPSIKERLRHHSPTLPDNVCNTDISN